MVVQLVLNTLLILGYVVITNMAKYDQKARKGFVIYASILLILHAGLRGLEVGADTEHYFSRFLRVQDSSLSELIENTLMDRSLLFFPFIKVFQLFCNNYQVFLFVIATFFYLSFFRMLYKNAYQTRDIFVAILVFQILFLYLPFSSFKQAIAMSIILYAFESYKHKKNVRTTLLILLAAAFHPSAILFSLIFIVAPFKMPRLLIILTLIGSVLLFTFGRSFVEIMSSLAGGDNDYYMQQYAENKTNYAGAYAFMGLMLVVLVADFLMYKKIVKLNSQYLYFINFASFALLLTPLAWVNPTLIRLLGYYSIYIVVLIPIIINSIKPKELSRVLYCISCLFFLVYTVFVKYEEYYFFWE